MAAAQLAQIGRLEFAAAAGRENGRRTSVVEHRTRARKLNSLIVIPFEAANPLKTSYRGSVLKNRSMRWKEAPKTAGQHVLRGNFCQYKYGFAMGLRSWR
jgi:hypothetical protein